MLFSDLELHVLLGEPGQLRREQQLLLVLDELHDRYEREARGRNGRSKHLVE